MSRFNIPVDMLTARMNLSERFSSVRSQSLTSRVSNLKPLAEFFDLKRLSKPENFSDVQSRVNYNLGYFASNYVAMSIMLLIYALISNPLLLFVIILVSVGMWAIGMLGGADLDIGILRATTSQLYTGLFIIAVPLGIWARPVGTALWLIGACGASVMGHATFMEKPIESAFSEEAV